MLPHRVTRCLLCRNVDIEVDADGRFVTTKCHACFAVLQIEFDPPDQPTLRARIERIDEADTPATVSSSRSPRARRPPSERAN